MKLSLSTLNEKEFWQSAGVSLPEYDVPAMVERTKAAPVWVHFGAGNIFRGYVAKLQDALLCKGLAEKGIVAVDSSDGDQIVKVYDPFDNLTMLVSLYADGSAKKEIVASVAEAVHAAWEKPASLARLKEIFRDPGLQMVSFTITEKGYAIRSGSGEFLPAVAADIENGPANLKNVMAKVTALLLERFNAGAKPIAVVSMDNCSHNGEKLKASIVTIAEEWEKKGFVSAEFVQWICNEDAVSFPWSMIDKITPRPAEAVADALEELGVENMQPVITSRKTYIAPFVNAEDPQYLVVEDNFPNGRPPLEKAGVYMTSRDTVNSAERMKVTVCLNPLHTALCTYDCMLGYDLFADGMSDPELAKLVRLVGCVEGMDVVENPGIISPEEFIEEVIGVRFPNPYLGDTAQRIAVDISQMVGIRFGENVKAYVDKYGDAKKLVGIPLAIAGWLRYLLAVDDQGKPFELSPDPMIPELQSQMAGITFGQPDSLKDQLKPILSNKNIFGVDLYEAGIGEVIEGMVREEISGPGAVRETLKKYLP